MPIVECPKRSLATFGWTPADSSLDENAPEVVNSPWG